MRGAADLKLLERPLPDLARDVTGVEPGSSGHVLIDKALRVRSTQRLAIARVDGGVVAFTWPGELQSQARFLYSSDRAHRLVGAAREGGWDIDTRPHLAFWNSPPSQRLYLNPTIGVDEYVERWAGADGANIRQHEAETIRPRLWPWLLGRGFASSGDERELDDFLTRLGRRAAHLRPGLRLLRRWEADEVEELAAANLLSDEIRAAVNDLFDAIGDGRLPAAAGQR